MPTVPCICSDQVARAQRIAASIEGAATDNVHIREERGLEIDDSGMDEEDRFSGVARKPVASGGGFSP